MKTKAFAARILSALLTAALLGTVCACRQSAAPVSGNELEALRARYPYAVKNDRLSTVNIGDMAAFHNDEFAAFAVVTVTGDCTKSVSEDSPAPGMAKTSVTTYLIPARVDSTLCQSSSFRGEKEITLRIRGAMDESNLDCYQTGKTLLTMLTVVDPALNAKADEYFSGTETSFFLTENRVLLAMSDQHTAFVDYSGWDLDSFRDKIKPVFS